MNIYINEENEVKLRKLENSSMSGLINHLLEDYFNSHYTITQTHIEANSEIEKASVSKHIQEAHVHFLDKKSKKKGKL